MMLLPMLSFFLCFVLENSFAAPFYNSQQNPLVSEPTVNRTDVISSEATPKTPTSMLPFDAGSRVILIVEKRSFIVAGGLVLVTCVVLLIGTIVASCCGSRSDYHYTILSQGDLFENIPADVFLSADLKNLKTKHKCVLVNENFPNPAENSRPSVADDKKLNDALEDHMSNLSNDLGRTGHVSDKLTDAKD